MAIFDVSGLASTPVKKKAKATESPRHEMTEQEAQEDLMRVFPAMVCGDVQSMRQVLVEARGLYEPERTRFLQSRLMTTTHKLMSQGSVFGYPLVTDVATHLYNFIQSHQSFDSADLNVLQNDLVMLQNILWKKLSGDGGEMGRKMLNQLI